MSISTQAVEFDNAQLQMVQNAQAAHAHLDTTTRNQAHIEQVVASPAPQQPGASVAASDPAIPGYLSDPDTTTDFNRLVTMPVNNLQNTLQPASANGGRVHLADASNTQETRIDANPVGATSARTNPANNPSGAGQAFDAAPDYVGFKKTLGENGNVYYADPSGRWIPPENMPKALRDPQMLKSIIAADASQKEAATRQWADAYVAKEREGGGVLQRADDAIRRIGGSVPALGAWADEANAATGAALGSNEYDYDMRLAYEHAKDRALDATPTAKIANVPLIGEVTTGGLEKATGFVGGMIALPFAKVFKGSGALPTAGNAAINGGVYNAADAAGAAEKDKGSAATEGFAWGVGLGGLLGSALHKAAPAAAWIGNKVPQVANTARTVIDKANDYAIRNGLPTYSPTLGIAGKPGKPASGWKTPEGGNPPSAARAEANPKSTEGTPAGTPHAAEDILGNHDNYVNSLPFTYKEKAFCRFVNRVYDEFKEAGYDDIHAFMQGSAASGRQFKTGKELNARLGIKPSDYDVAIVSPKLLQKAQDLGIDVLHGPLGAKEVAALGLTSAQNALSKASKGEIAVEFKIYRTIEDVYDYGKTIPFVQWR